jgi:tetratricopeptide (TPR) repeat protein
VNFNLIPLGGATHLAAPLHYRSRLGLWLTVFAGPGLHLALHLLFRLIAKDPALNEMLFHSTLPGVAVFMGALVNANFYLAISNLIPLRLTTSDGMAITDGYQLLRIPFYGEKEMLDYRIIGILAEANELKQSGHFAETHALYETWLAQYPTHEMLRAARAHLYVDLGNYASARDELQLLLATPRAQKQSMFRLSLLHSLAYVNALLNDPRHLLEADEYSSSVIQELPSVAPAMGMRGAVLLRLHETQEGLDLLKESARRASNQLSRAKYQCWLAIGHAMENDFIQAKQYLELARDCGITFHFLRQAEHEVERLYQHSLPRAVPLPSTSLPLVA